MKKPRLSFWHIWNMSFGFFGIQFGWGLQMANMSAIYEFLGANPEQIPLLWLAAPVTGLIVQPIIGHMSDRTWNRLGRRRPYFLVGAILASIALIFMPNSGTLWMAAGMLWVLDASVNISMEPFRAFVADMLPEEQRPRGFAMQSFMIGGGAIIASALPYMLTNWFNVPAASTPESPIPPAIHLAFYIGAAVFFAAVLWTVLTSREYPPDDIEAFRRKKAETAGAGRFVADIFDALKKMPYTMRQLAWVQIFTWLGLFCMWIYFSVAVANNIFGADPGTELYTQGIAWGGVCFAVYNGVCFGFAIVLLWLTTRFSPKAIHTVCLACGGLGLVSVMFIRTPELLLISMVGVGIAWASILSMPYAMLAGSLPPERIGVYMGIFNFFIVIPQIVAALGFGWVMSSLLGNNRLYGVVAGGVAMLIAALLTMRVRVIPPEADELQRVAEEQGMLPTATPPESPL